MWVLIYLFIFLAIFGQVYAWLVNIPVIDRQIIAVKMGFGKGKGKGSFGKGGNGKGGGGKGKGKGGGKGSKGEDTERPSQPKVF